MERLTSAGLLVSRLLISSIFLFSGAKKVVSFGATQSYMAANGMKMTGLFLVAAILLEVGGGLSVLLGYLPRLGALALVLYLAPTTLVFHRNLADPVQVVQLAKNLAIMGGLVAIIAAGGGLYAVRGGREGR